MTAILDLLTQVSALLGEAARVDRSTLSDDELIAVLKADEVAGRFADASRVLDAGEVAERSRYEFGAAGLSMRLSERKPTNFIERVTLISQAEASRRCRIGLAIRNRQSMLGEVLPPDHAIVAEALVSGLMGIDTASTILYSLTQAARGSGATPERLDEAELELVTMGATESADLVADFGRLWRDALDPDGIEPRYEDILERQMVTVGRERNGIKNYNVKAGPTLSALLDAVFLDSMDPRGGPRFLSEEDLARAELIVTTHGDETNARQIEIGAGENGADENDASEKGASENGAGVPRDTGTGGVVVTIVDPRSLERKRADILEGVLTAALRATREGSTDLRTVGTVTAVISLNDLHSGSGFGILEGTDEVVPASVVQEIACESGYYPVVVGERGEPLFHGRLKRYFTAPQRRAIVARDGDRCIAPGCKRRAAACHAHHVRFFEDDGSTDVDNGVMLCPAHHHALHQGAFELKMVDGMPYRRNSVDRFDDTAWRPTSRNRLLLARR